MPLTVCPWETDFLCHSWLLTGKRWKIWSCLTLNHSPVREKNNTIRKNLGLHSVNWNYYLASEGSCWQFSCTKVARSCSRTVMPYPLLHSVVSFECGTKYLPRNLLKKRTLKMKISMDKLCILNILSFILLEFSQESERCTVFKFWGGPYRPYRQWLGTESFFNSNSGIEHHNKSFYHK